MSTDEEYTVEPIAVVGLSCRLPGAPDVPAFWRNLVDGVESVRFYTKEEQAALGVPGYLLDDPTFVRAASIAADYGALDAPFFGMSPREAETRDPQHRMFLELAHSALEDAGYDPARYPGEIGVYGAVGSDEYQWMYIRRDKSVHASVGNLGIYVGNHPDYLSTLVSYKLDLRGPSLTMHTACSSSLVALHVACEALRAGECDMVLTGGVSIEMPPEWGYQYHQDGIYAADGHCRAFDAGAKGTVWGGGGGVAVLKRLSEAVAAGDHIRAIVIGNAINNDGATKVGFSAPSSEGQAVAVAQALDVAGADPRTVTYVEAHGTGTSMGDPIEVAALSNVFHRDTTEAGWCGIGSVKTNIGHLGPAAGIAGFVKTVLALENGLIPPSINFERPNPEIGFGKNPFYVVSAPTKWEPEDFPRRAGVSSFGIGGTNAHVVLQEAPPLDPVPREPRTAHLLRLSARTPSALAAMATRLADRLEEPGQDLDLADVAFTLGAGRREMKHRAVVVASDAADAVRALRDPRRLVKGSAGRPRVAWLFSGQGSQYAGMGAELYRAEETFRAAVDECAEILRDEIGLDLRDLLMPAEADRQAAEERLRRTEFTQPALFTVEYALARFWRSCGVEPSGMIGHSIGEYVAAACAGVFDLPDALRLVAARGRLMQGIPPGSMLAVRLDQDELRGRLPDGLSIATVNGPGACVVAGPDDLVDRYAATLAEDGTGHTRLRTSHAFHSPMMDPVLAEFHDLVAGVTRHVPGLPFLSNLTGTWITAEEAVDPAYWTRHLRETVRFGDCVATLLAEGDWLMVECGPGRQLAGLARTQVRQGGTAPLASLPGPSDAKSDLQVLCATAGTLWTAGAAVDPGALTAPGRRVPLPHYPFERSHHWVPILPDPEMVYPAPPRTGALPVQEWFSVPAWRQAPVPVTGTPLTGRCLAFAGPTAAPLVAALRAGGAEVVTVTAGDAYGRSPDGSFTVRPGVREDYDALVAEAGVPERVVHAWALDEPPDERTPGRVWAAQDLGFFSLLNLVQALAQADREADVHLDVLTAGTQGVVGADLTRPEHATVAGIAKVVPLEAPWLSVRHVDLADPSHDLAPLLAELARDPALDRPEEGTPPSPVALRGGRRWVRGYEPVEVTAADAGLRQGGVYVITGGLGGIGVTLAEDLAVRLRARLVLLGRSGLPPREEWDALAGGADRTSRAVAAIRRMEAAGAQVLTLAADVTDAGAMRRVREETLARFGRVDGVVHAAGLPGGGMAEVKERETAESVLAPKILGAVALREAFGDLDLDVVMLCSSVTAVAGGFGQVDYCAANNFLDAYAQTWPGRVVSVNWGAWLEVGMAAEVAAPVAFRALQRGDRVTALDHPVLTHRHEPSADRLPWCTGQISPATHWLLDEHRIAGVAVMPGTGYLETARHAFEASVPSPGPGHVVELRDVAFTTPLSLADDASAELRVVFAPGGDGVEFEVTSVAGERSTSHARGIASWVPAAARADDAGDLAEVRLRCSYGISHATDEMFSASSSGLLTFGSRWGGVRAVHMGQNEHLARLEAGREAAAELDRLPLHPALLDEATAFVSALVGGKYLPLGYGRLTLLAPLPAKLWSHARLRDTEGGEIVAVDLTLYDDGGERVAEVADFVLRRIDAADVARGVDEAARETAGAQAVDEQSAAAGAALDAEGAKRGIAPAEGADAFRRLVAFDLGVQVVVNATPLAEFVAGVRELTQDTVAEELGTTAGEAVADDDATGHVAPRTELESTLAGLWCEVLGAKRVSVEDEFFELGGNSLVAVQLIALLRKKLGVRLPMRSLFQVPTVRGMAALVEEIRAQGSGGGAGKDAAPAASGGDKQVAIKRLPRMERA
ncbi:type I polyketide synthase [Sphaerisporangium sp. TRM90804]|uniref:type I polyketide synthase n=1 Tax=Sphaerisporangium sp. TRM90804 TaxID=3031113 RepID=UPI002446DEC6|nr:type I polyketide synthase [Sphaerisporangium sp. TRM90804]MDH2425407.1 SDR family NAD(P)-dependent oxidoreductase [Sphaerisporangium sp. TRM90804]